MQNYTPKRRYIVFNSGRVIAWPEGVPFEMIEERVKRRDFEVVWARNRKIAFLIKIVSDQLVEGKGVMLR